MQLIYHQGGIGEYVAVNIPDIRGTAHFGKQFASFEYIKRQLIYCIGQLDFDKSGTSCKCIIQNIVYIVMQMDLFESNTILETECLDCFYALSRID